MEAFDTCSKGLKFQEKSNNINATRLINLGETAPKKPESTLRQNNIDSYFKCTIFDIFYY